MSTNGHEGIWETDFSIDYKHLNFEGEVAEGAFGKIFKGDYFGTPVAIKKFIESGYAEDDQKYIAREVATLKGIRHPCIVNFMGVCMHSSGVYIVTEWIPNGDLTNLLKNASVDISWKERTQMLMDAAVAMRYLHAHGIIHRDLKSENLLLTENGRVKVCDLGFARTTKKLTRCMSVAGTELYMAPEVMLGEDYDEKCDVFSFGIVVFEVVCRHPPPKRSLETKYGFPSGLLTQYMPPDCPPDLALLVMECTHYEKEGRPSFEDIFRSLKELFDELEAEEAATFVSDNQARARIEQERQARLEREQAEREQREQEEKDRREQEERDRKARAVKEKREKELREREKQKKKQEQQQQKQAEDDEEARRRREQDEAAAKERESQLRAQLEREVMEKLEQEKRAIREQLEQEYAQKEREREERERKERAEREEREREEREERDRRARDEAVLALASPRSRGASSSSSSGVSISVSKLDSGSSGTEQQQQPPGKKERARSWALRGPRKSGLKQALKEESAKAQPGQLSSQSSETLGQTKSAEADATAKVKKAAAAKEAKERRRSWAPMRLLEEKEKKEKKKKAKEEKRKKEEEEKNKKKEEKKKKKIEKKIKEEEKKVENDKKHARTRSGSMAAVISGSNQVVVAEHELESSP